jgi:heptaprenyl diphosphate synthase
VTVEGLILLSRASVRSDLRLPGAFGSLLGESFRYFDRIMERKGGIERKDPIGGIDRLMNELWNDRASVSGGGYRIAATRRPALGYLALAVGIAAAWIPFLAARLAGTAILF